MNVSISGKPLLQCVQRLPAAFLPMVESHQRWRWKTSLSCSLFLVALSIECVLPSKDIFLIAHEERVLSHFPYRLREEALNRTREMFYFGWDNYMQYAWPADELDPIHCTGRGHDHNNPENININDVLGDYSLTLVDSLDSLVVFGDVAGFKQAVRLVISTVSFDRNTTVQVFEATIRMIGSLLSAHLIASDSARLLGNFYMADYEGELLDLARDLATRLLPAFEGTTTGLPYPRVNLQRGVLEGTINETCTAGAGSLLLEFGLLSRLTGDPIYASVARRINTQLWHLRDGSTGLLGNVLNIQTGTWNGFLSGLGAGLDSFYEYMLKSYIMFGQAEDLVMFERSYAAIRTHMRRGRDRCRGGNDGEPPIYVNVDSRDGSTANTWIDALQASFPSVQTLAGDVEEAICHHAIYYAIWRKFGVLPERFNWAMKQPDVSFYPLRPEFAESTYHLYQATRNPFYLHVGTEILDSLDRITRVKCGFATVHDVKSGELEDRMESFFLSETLKYLYLLFDDANPVNKHGEKLLFSTEGHILPIAEKKKTHEEESSALTLRELPIWKEEVKMLNSSCVAPTPGDRHSPPLSKDALVGVFESIGLDESDWW